MSAASEVAAQIRGWLFQGEPEELERLAAGKTVLEIGSYCGKSTVVMARVANRVVAIDDFRGAPGSNINPDSGGVKNDSGPSLRQAFFDNLDRFGVAQKVTPVVATLESVLPTMNLDGVEMVFYDADHTYASTYNGGRQLFQRLPPSCTIVFHDYGDSDPGVIQAVNRLSRETGRPFRQVSTLAIFDGQTTSAAPAAVKSYNVALMTPGRSFIWGAVRGVYEATTKHDIQIRTSGTGWDDFNTCWCETLNQFEAGTITHAAMLHADISPEAGWLDALLDEMDRLQADFVSAVAPIKDRRGVTSSGIGNPRNRWVPFRRFTIRELCAGQLEGMNCTFGETFNAADVGYPGGILLHNTGCWVADLRNPKWLEVDDAGCMRAFFDFPRRVSRGPDGRWTCNCESEDWYISRKMHELGLKTYINRKVRLVHQGIAEYPNNEPWGTNFHGDESLSGIWRNPDGSTKTYPSDGVA